MTIKRSTIYNMIGGAICVLITPDLLHAFGLIVVFGLFSLANKIDD